MTHAELIQKHKNFFGEPIAHFPEDYSKWSGKPCTVFFAPCEHWTFYRLTYCIKFETSFEGPYNNAISPVAIPSDGFLVFLPDSNN